MRTKLVLLAAAAASTAILAACGSGTSSASHSMPGMSTPSGMSMPSSSGANMGGMSMPSGTGLSATTNGYTLSVTDAPMAGMAMPVTFVITKSGKPVTMFDAEQTKLMHFYLIRADLSGFQHLHPTMATDGTWSVTPAELTPGTHRIYVQFLPQADAAAGALVLSRAVTIPGSSESSPLPAPASTTTVDGYTVAVSGTPKAGTDTPISLTVSRDGEPVTDLQPYLDTYAHVTAIHQGDLAFAHLHPQGSVNGDSGGPTLTVQADLPEPGKYRMFIQFQTGGTLHTAPITITAT